LTLVFIAVTGLVVLGGHTRIENPGLNFQQPFKGHITPYGATTSLYRIIFSYAGYENAFNVANEVRVGPETATIFFHGVLTLA
jgi:amino acid transporter